MRIEIALGQDKVHIHQTQVLCHSSRLQLGLYTVYMEWSSEWPPVQMKETVPVLRDDLE